MRCARIRARCKPRRNLRRLLRRFDAGRHRLPPGAALPRRGSPAAGTTAEAQALRFDIGWDWVPFDPAPRPREVLPALPPVPRRQEAPAAGQLFAALHPAGAWRGARCGRAGRSACSTSSSTRSPTTRWCSRTRKARARRAAGDFRRPFPRHAAGAGDELREGGDPGAGEHFRAPPQQAGRSGDQRRPAGLPDRQRGRHRVRPHDRAVHRRGDRQRPGQPRACRRRCIRSRPAPTPRTTCRWARTRRATCWRWPTTSARCWRWSCIPPRRRWTCAAT